MENTSSSSSSSGSSSGSSSRSSASMGGARRRRKSHRRRRSMRGGMGASEWELNNVGGMNKQWDNVFVKGGNFGNAVQNLAGTQPSLVTGAFPSAANLNLIQSAGSRRKMGRRTRSKRGGSFGNVFSQALVPFSLWFAQNRFGARKHSTRKSRTRKYRK